MFVHFESAVMSFFYFIMVKLPTHFADDLLGMPPKRGDGG